jgi:hypothetical protein
MSRVDREFGGTSTQRVSQHAIFQVHARDDIGQGAFNPEISSEDMDWEEERKSQPLSVKLSELAVRS